MNENDEKKIKYLKRLEMKRKWYADNKNKVTEYNKKYYNNNIKPIDNHESSNNENLRKGNLKFSDQSKNKSSRKHSRKHSSKKSSRKHSSKKSSRKHSRKHSKKHSSKKHSRKHSKHSREHSRKH